MFFVQHPDETAVTVNTESRDQGKVSQDKMAIISVQIKELNLSLTEIKERQKILIELDF